MKKIRIISATLALIELLSNGYKLFNKNSKSEVIKPKKSINILVDNREYEISNNVSKIKNGNKKGKYYRLNDENGEIYELQEQIDSHYVFVSEITDDGKIIVSSWGEKYVFENSKANWTSKTLIKINN